MAKNNPIPAPIPSFKLFGIELINQALIGVSEIIKNKQAIYDLKVDKRINKIGEGNILEQYPLDKLPKFLQNNLENYKEWID